MNSQTSSMSSKTSSLWNYDLPTLRFELYYLYASWHDKALLTIDNNCEFFKRVLELEYCIANCREPEFQEITEKYVLSCFYHIRSSKMYNINPNHSNYLLQCETQRKCVVLKTLKDNWLNDWLKSRHD